MSSQFHDIFSQNNYAANKLRALKDEQAGYALPRHSLHQPECGVSRGDRGRLQFLEVTRMLMPEMLSSGTL
jgi:hypothetical protein